jgi:hypothetical protein
MSDSTEHSLSDDQVKTDYRTDPDFLPEVLREFVALENRITDTDGAEEIMVPVKTLHMVRMGMRAMIKTQTELGALGFGFDNDHGDRGASCDYNPFAGINTGDLLPH